MRPKTLEISWHETQAVYSCDFQALPAGQLKRLLALANDEDEAKEKGPLIAGGRQYRLATAGGDSKVRLWLVHPNIPNPSTAAQSAAAGQDVTPHPPRAEYLATLSKHTAPVNVVRFSPNGQTLASAGDDGNVILWVPSDRPAAASFGETSQDDIPDKEHWRLQKSLQVTTKHVYDLAWSPDGEFFIVGTTDNTASVWKASTGECVYVFREHQHNVQGVTWDPLNEYIASQSSDRSVHVNSFAFRNGVPESHPVSRATRMEIRHSRTPSFPSGSRPSMVRRCSTTSEAGSVVTSASEHTENLNNLNAAPMTPSASVPSTPQHVTAMNPPISNKPGSRRSSFSGSQAAASPSLSAATFRGRGRSPSPIPPLPAIRAPPTSSHAIMQTLYGDEGATRFFRRLTFSPDGSLLLTPAGQIEDQLYKGSPMLTSRSLSHDGSTDPTSTLPRARAESAKALGDNGKPTVYLYSRANLSRQPIAHLPGHKSMATAIRFSPVFYDLRSGPATSTEPKQVILDRSEPGPINVSLSMPPPPLPAKEDKEDTKEKDAKDGKEGSKTLNSVFALPYRLVYAVACQESVYLYDTQQSGPIAIFRGLHYAGFTDVAWSPDGQALMLSSSDGYCSIVVFDLMELGTVHPTQQHHRQLAAIAQSHSHTHHSTSTASTPVPQSPAVSTMRQSPAPARSEREGSTSSSIAPHQSTSIPPLFVPMPAAVPPPSSTTSSVDPIPPTPDESEKDFATIKVRTGRSESESSQTAPGLFAGASSEDAKRPASGKRKRRKEETDSSYSFG